MKNFQVTFHRAMYVIQATVSWQFGRFFLCDVFVFLKSPTEHITSVATVVRLPESNVITLKLTECFFSNAIDFCGSPITSRNHGERNENDGSYQGISHAYECKCVKVFSRAVKCVPRIRIRFLKDRRPCKRQSEEGKAKTFYINTGWTGGC